MPTASHHLAFTPPYAVPSAQLTLLHSAQHRFDISHLPNICLGFSLHTSTMSIIVWILACLTGILLCIHWCKKYTYWMRQNVPQLTAVPILGSFVPTKKPLQELELEFYKKHGRIYGRYDGSTPVLSVADPELLKRILVKDFHLFSSRRDIKFNDPVVDNTLFSLEGEDWKRVRSIVSPTLTSAKLKRMLPLMEDCAEMLIENILDTLKEKKSVNLQRIFGAFVIDTIAKCAFGISINSLTSEDHPFVAKATRLLDCNFGWRTILIMICPNIMKLLSIRLLNPETTQFYREIILDVMQQKRKAKGREDFLQLLLEYQANVAAQDQNNNNVKEKNEEAYCKTDSQQESTNKRSINNHTTSSENNHTSPSANNHSAENGHNSSPDNNHFNSSPINQTKGNHSAENGHNSSPDNNHFNSSPINQTKVLSHDEVVAQCVTFFMAGYDATTTLLTYSLYNLAMNQDYQDRVIEEIQTALKEHDGELNYETLSKLKFMDAVLNECLRLCPAMVRNERRVTKDCVIGDTNIELKKGMLISIPLYAMHRDPEWFPEPDEFRPERFYEADPNRPHYVHLPFGAGPRICVGFRFVMMQVKLCLARVLLRFRAEPGLTTPARLGFTEVRNVLKVNEVEISLVDRQQSFSDDQQQLSGSE